MHSPHQSLQRPKWYLLPLTGTSTTEVQQKSIVLSRYIQQYPYVTLGQVATLLGQEVTDNAFRQAALINDAAQLAEQLATNEIKTTAVQTSRTVFMFPGIGDHYLQMGRGLYETLPYFREIVDECDAALRPFLNQSLTKLLYPETNSPVEAAPTSGLDLAAMLGRKPTANTNDEQEARLQETAVAHPLVFSIEYALARLLQQWGIEPDGLIGYSLGEYVAATIAGVLTLEDALTLVARRAQLIQALPPGKMLAVPLSQEDATPYLSQQVSLSAHNGDALTILAGETEAVLDVQQQLQKQQVACRLLDTTHAFHSHMMQGAVTELTKLAQTITYAAPKIPYLSNVTGTWITAKQATDPTYWTQHMCQPVQYFSMLRNLLGQGQTHHLIEVGPGQSLGAFVKQHPQCKPEQYALIYPTIRYSYDHQDDHWILLATLRKLWLSGVNLQWATLLSGHSDLVFETPEQPLSFTSPQGNVLSQQAIQQKDRGEKRRQNRLRRRGSRTENG
jgi:acyl transferase domain-containing protein